MASAGPSHDPQNTSNTFPFCTFNSPVGISGSTTSQNTWNFGSTPSELDLQSIHEQEKAKPGLIAENSASWLFSYASDLQPAKLFRDFRDDFDGDNMTLACPGYPGAGKTIRAVLIKDHLTAMRNSFAKPHESAVSALYLGHNELKKKSHRELIIYLLKDLQRQCCGLSVRNEWLDAVIRNLCDKKSPSDELVFKSFDSICQSLRAYFIVIDGLEEYPWFELNMLLEFINRLQSKHSPTIKLYATYKEMGNIAERFKGCKTFPVQADDDDIEDFIDLEINHSRKLSQFVADDPDLRQNIKSAVLNVSDRLCVAHMKRLNERDFTLDAFKQMLSNLPHMTADDCYRDEMLRIREMTSEKTDLALKILSLVYYSGQSLNLGALQYALALEPNTQVLPGNESILSAAEITLYTRGLVSIHEHSGNVSAFHQTARTYFGQVQWCDFPEAADYIISVCVKHLSFLGTEVFPTKEAFGKHNFTQFALAPICEQIRLIEHHDDVTFEKDTVTMSVPLLQSLHNMSSVLEPDRKPTLCRSTTEHVRRTVMTRDLREQIVAVTKHPMARCYFFGNSTHGQRLYNTAPTSTGPLHFAALLGSQVVLRRLIAEGMAIDDAHGQDDTALTISMKLGFEHMVNILLESGAAIDLRFSSGWEVLLHIVSQKGPSYECIAKQALETASKEALRKKSSNKARCVLLLKSAYDGTYADFESAFKKCRKLPPTNNVFITAFLIAVERKPPATGKQEAERDHMVHKLLKHGIDINAQDRSGNTALHRASNWNNERMVQYLLDNGADPSIKNVAGHTPWYIICSKPSHQAISRLLIAKGADPDACDGQGIFCLYMAAAGGHLESMVAILEAGTNPGIATKYGWTPMHWAAGNGRYEATKLLLEWDQHTEKANPNARSDVSQTPLDRAIESDHTDIIELLILHGAKRGRELNVAPSSSVGLERQSDSMSLTSEDLDDLYYRLCRGYLSSPFGYDEDEGDTFPYRLPAAQPARKRTWWQKLLRRRPKSPPSMRYYSSDTGFDWAQQELPPLAVTPKRQFLRRLSRSGRNSPLSASFASSSYFPRSPSTALTSLPSRSRSAHSTDPSFQRRWPSRGATSSITSFDSALSSSSLPTSMMSGGRSGFPSPSHGVTHHPSLGNLAEEPEEDVSTYEITFDQLHTIEQMTTPCEVEISTAQTGAKFGQQDHSNLVVSAAMRESVSEAVLSQQEIDGLRVPLADVWATDERHAFGCEREEVM